MVPIFPKVAFLGVSQRIEGILTQPGLAHRLGLIQRARDKNALRRHWQTRGIIAESFPPVPPRKDKVPFWREVNGAAPVASPSRVTPADQVVAGGCARRRRHGRVWCLCGRRNGELAWLGWSGRFWICWRHPGMSRGLCRFLSETARRVMVTGERM